MIQPDWNSLRLVRSMDYPGYYVFVFFTLWTGTRIHYAVSPPVLPSETADGPIKG